MTVFATLFKTKGAVFDTELDDLFSHKNGVLPLVHTSQQLKRKQSSQVDSEDDDNSSDESESETEDGSNSDDADEQLQIPDTKSPRQLGKEKQQRTLFISNVSVVVAKKPKQKELKRLFSQYGAIESMRLRSIAFTSALPRKLNFKLQNLHPERDTLNVYIVYKSPDSIEKAMAMNGKIFESKHLRVDRAFRDKTDSQKRGQDNKRCVFVGNLPFDVKEENMWTEFGAAGEIEYVRVIRDRKVGIGKGFAYVQYVDKSSVASALKLQGTEFLGKTIRVFKCKDNTKVQAKPESYVGDTAANHKKPRIKQRVSESKHGHPPVKKVRTDKQKSRSLIQKLKKVEKKQKLQKKA